MHMTKLCHRFLGGGIEYIKKVHLHCDYNHHKTIPTLIKQKNLDGPTPRINAYYSDWMSDIITLHNAIISFKTPDSQ